MFRKLTREELTIIAPILDSPTQTVEYFDPTENDYVTLSTYTGDWSVENKNIIENGTKNEGFECSFISREKR